LSARVAALEAEGTGDDEDDEAVPARRARAGIDS
jgi:hypothetical protein